MVQDRAKGEGVGAMRERILEAAKDLFLKKGFENVSMRAIATRIGYSPGAIYRYFKNKKEILSVLRHEAFGEYLAQINSIGAGKEPLERVRATLVMYYHFALADSDMFDLMFNLGPSTVALGGQWATRPREVFSLFCADIEACQKKGLFKGASVETVGVTLWSAVHGFATLAVRQRIEALVPDFDAQKTGKEVVDFLLRNA